MNSLSIKLKLAEDLLTLSQSMWLAAQAMQWEDLPDLQQQREQMVAAVFADVPADGFTDEKLLAILHEIQVLGDAMTTLVAEERERISHELLELRKSRKADSAYRIP